VINFRDASFLLPIAIAHIEYLIEVRNRDDASEAEVLLAEHFASNFLAVADNYARLSAAPRAAVDPLLPLGSTCHRCKLAIYDDCVGDAYCVDCNPAEKRGYKNAHERDRAIMALCARYGARTVAVWPRIR
jgi:hypothetical protein